MLKKLWSRQRFQRAQSLLEFAIFGSLLIMLIGVLINYGLKYNFQQEVTQEAFRKALRSAADANLEEDPITKKPTPISVTHVIIKDKHIPDPTNPFGIGSAQPVSSQAAVTRSWKLDETPDEDKVGELPIMRIEIQGKSQDFRLAGIREVNIEQHKIDLDAVEKYKEIYGANSVWATEITAKGFNRLLGCHDKDECAELLAGDELKGASNVKIKLAILDPMGSFGAGSGGAEGREIIDYNTGVRICRQIVDKDICKTECYKGRLLDPEALDICRNVGTDDDARIDCYKANSPDIDTKEMEECNDICNTDIPVPWYCEYTSEAGEGTVRKYTFVELDRLFSGFESMGVQPGYTKTTKMTSEIRKSEDTSGITTTDVVDWQDKTVREIKSLEPKTNTRQIKTEEATSDVIQKKEKEWEAKW